ncbi:hypothetical protein NDU88_004872 [Pleurodeles waltl]|uniref:Uncharacterized protein n=1 Tax=Pleurodeles waltl TaxID=8319 RepID=A0AAV7NMB4_PLEWA|nr:hypothetical protein NDU88_004872 [Pleurodeles waltl]
MSATSSSHLVQPLMVPVCPGAHLCAPSVPMLVVDTGPPLDKGTPVPPVSSAAWDPISKSRSGPVAPSFSTLPAHLRFGELRAPPDPPRSGLQLPGTFSSRAASPPASPVPSESPGRSPQAARLHASPRLHGTGQADGSQSPRLLREPLDSAQSRPHSSSVPSQAPRAAVAGCPGARLRFWRINDRPLRSA